MMKKCMMMLFALMMVLLLECSALAQDYYTLPEVREQAAQGWHETYTDKYGRTREVDIDIDVYGNDTAPVLKAGWGDPSRFFFWYGEEERGPYDDIIEAMNKRNGVTTYLYDDIRGMKVDLDFKYAEDYGSELTLQESYAIMKEELQEHRVDQDYLWEQPAEFNLLYSKNKKTGEVVAPPLYYLALWPTEFGLPVLSHVVYSFDRGVHGPCDTPEFSFQISNYESYYGYVGNFDIQEVLAEDIPLCSVEKVIEGARKMIEDGHINQVVSLRFGYVVHMDPDYEWNGRDTAYDIPTHYLVPSWVMECYVLRNPKVDNLQEHQGLRELTINAQTGEMMDYFDTSLYGRGDGRYKGFISWDDVK